MEIYGRGKNGDRMINKDNSRADGKTMGLVLQPWSFLEEIIAFVFATSLPYSLYISANISLFWAPKLLYIVFSPGMKIKLPGSSVLTKPLF